MTSVASDEHDVLAEYENGYDGLLKLFSVHLSDHADRLEGAVELDVTSTIQGSMAWFRVRVEFAEISRMSMHTQFFVGGGRVLYNGAKLIKSKSSDMLTLDLDPGVAWRTSGAPSPASCVLVGRGTVTVTGA